MISGRVQTMSGRCQGTLVDLKKYMTLRWSGTLTQKKNLYTLLLGSRGLREVKGIRDSQGQGLSKNKAKAISAKLLALNLKVQMYNHISVLVTFQFWRHFSVGDLSVLVTFQFW